MHFPLSILATKTREPKPERLEPLDLAGVGAEAILFFLQEPEHFKKLEWSRNWI